MYIAAHVPWTDAAIAVDGLGTTADTAITGLGIENDQILLTHAKNCIECHDHFTLSVYRVNEICRRASDCRWTVEDQKQ